MPFPTIPPELPGRRRPETLDDPDVVALSQACAEMGGKTGNLREGTLVVFFTVMW